MDPALGMNTNPKHGTVSGTNRQLPSWRFEFFFFCIPHFPVIFWEDGETVLH